MLWVSPPVNFGTMRPCDWFSFKKFVCKWVSMTQAKSDYICLRVGVPFVLLQIVCFDKKNCCVAAVVQSKQELSALQEQAAVARRWFW